jgi:hypothetical protein
LRLLSAKDVGRGRYCSGKLMAIRDTVSGFAAVSSPEFCCSLQFSKTQIAMQILGLETFVP